MKARIPSVMFLGAGLVALGVGLLIFVPSWRISAWVPALMGLALMNLGRRGTNGAMILFGHLCLLVGCFIFTWGMYDLVDWTVNTKGSQPVSGEKLLRLVFTRPLFWGLFSILAGFCANYHGFCRCVQMRRELRKEESSCGRICESDGPDDAA